MRVYVVNQKRLKFEVTVPLFLSFILLLLALFYFYTKWLIIALSLVIGALLFYAAPAVRRHTRRINIDFTPEGFSITTEHEGATTFEVFRLDDIANYELRLPTQKTSLIRFRFKGGGRKELSILNKPPEAGQVGAATLIDAFETQIKAYNLSVPAGAQIRLAPVFIASRGGLVFLLSQVVLVLVLAALYFTDRLKTTPVMLFVFLFSLLQLFNGRLQELNYYNRKKRALQ